MKLRKLLVTVFAIFAAGLIGLLVWLLQLDAKDIVAVIERQATQVTGRSLHIAGPVSMQWSLIPTVAVEGVSLHNTKWGSQPEMLRVKRVEVQLALLPLFSGDISIRKVMLDAPQVLLEINSKGERNWVFDESVKDEPASPRKLSIDIAALKISNGLVNYRPAAPAKATQLRIDSLALQTAKADSADIDGKFVFNDIPVRVSGALPSVALLTAGGGAAPLDIKLSALGVAVTVAGNVALDQPELEGTALQFSVMVDDPAASAAQLKITLPHLPRTQLAGRVLLGKAGLRLADAQLTSGKSNARLDVRLPLGAPRIALEVKLNGPLLDLAELLGPMPAGGAAPQKAAEKNRERIFSDAPLPLEGLNVADAKGDIKLARIVLRDGRVLQNLSTYFSLQKGRLALDPLSVSVEGKPLRVKLQADASRGRSLALNASIDAKGVPLASLAALAGVTATPQAAPTDLAIKVAARGASIRQLMASMDGDVRVVVGPGRWKGNAFDLSPALTSVFDVILPSGVRGDFTELQCAVFRFPVQAGVANIGNGIGVETSRIKLSANGSVNLRDETLSVGVHPKAVTGANIDVGNLARLVRVGGTLAAPTTGIDASGVASTALDLGIAMAKGGKGLSKSVFADTSPDNPCQVALGQAPLKGNAPQTSQTAPSPAQTVVDTLDAVRGLFGK